MNREILIENLKILFAAHHFVYISQDVDEIAKIVRVKRKKLDKWMTSSAWADALSLWGYTLHGDFDVIQRIWTVMIENGHDLFPIDFPDDLTDYITEHEN